MITRAPAERDARAPAGDFVASVPSPPDQSGHGEQRAVRIRRVGRRERHGKRDVPLFARRPQEIDGAWLRELRRTEAGDEVAAAHPAGFFHAPQHRIERAEAAGDLFDGGDFSSDDAVTREQLIRERGCPLGE